MLIRQLYSAHFEGKTTLQSISFGESVWTRKERPRSSCKPYQGR